MKRHLTEEELIEQKFKLASDEQAAARAEHLAGCAECRERLEMLDQKFAALDLLAEDVAVSDELIAQTVADARRPVRRRVVPFGKYHWIGTAAAVLVLGLVFMVEHPGQREAGQKEIDEQSSREDAWRFSGSALQRDSGEKQEVGLVAQDLADESEVLGEERAAGRMLAMRPAPTPSPVSADRPADELSTDPTARPDVRSNYALAPARGRGSVPEETDKETVMLRASREPAPELMEQMTLARKPALDAAKGPTSARAETLEGVAAMPAIVEAESVLAKISEKPPFAPASAIELVTLPRRDSVQLTIYNSADLTLVREKRNLTLKQGWNWLQLMWANTLIDPTSLSLEPAAQGDKIDVQQLVFPARLRELGRWLIRSEISGQVPFEITYFTSGLSWRAFYMGTLSQDETKMRLQGYVRVANGSGEDYENAQTRLLVGKVNVLDKIADLAKRQYAYGMPGVGSIESNFRLGEKADQYLSINGDLNWRAGTYYAIDGLRPKEIKKEGLSEYFLYTIEGTETVPDKWGKRLPSFDVDDIEVESLYKYDEERWGNYTIRFVSFANDDEHNLGQTPIPDGSIKIYGNASEQGYLSYVGESYAKYIPVGEEVELNLGSARLVEVEPRLMEFKTDNYVFDNRGNVAGWDEIQTWQTQVTNARAIPIEIEITRGFATPYWKLALVDIASVPEDAVSYEKHDATHARFTLKRRPNSKWSFGYAVTTYHGRRQGQVNE